MSKFDNINKISKGEKMIAEKRELGMEPEMPELCHISLTL
jgi:hypothetical protein